MIQLEINGLPIQVPSGLSVLQACEMYGVEVPRFCYESRLLVAGNCRMCLVEIVGSPKPQASCALPITPNMKVFTDSPLVKKAREYVLEFMLINHPRDCPICDQGGECDRQDQTMVYGSDMSRFVEMKRSVEDKDLGPIVSTVMTRCIHCTRCIRFSAERAGTPFLGTSGRGTATEVGTYVSRLMTSERSGNLTDLCPVGALTSLPRSFTYRAWEENASVDSVDASSSSLTPIRVKVLNGRIARVLPRDNDVTNGFLDDKSRYSFDAVYGGRAPRRLDARTSSGVALTDRTRLWSFVHSMRSGCDGVDVVVSPSVPQEVLDVCSSWSSRGLVNASVLGSSGWIQDELGLGVSMREVLSSQGTDGMVVRVGFDPRTESPLRNLRLRETYLKSSRRFVSVGESLDLTFPVQHLGNSRSSVLDRLSGRHALSAEFFGSSRPLVLRGGGLARTADGRSRRAGLRALSLGTSVHPSWRVVQCVPSHAMGSSSLPIFQPTLESKSSRALLTLGVSVGELAEYGRSRTARRHDYRVTVGCFTHATPDVAHWTVALPWPTFLEMTATYRNMMGESTMTTMSTRVLRDWSLVTLLEMLDTRVTTSGSGRSSRTTAMMGSGWPSAMMGSGWLSTRSRGALPVRHSYYTEGHELARMSRTMEICEKKLCSGSEWSESRWASMVPSSVGSVESVSSPMGVSVRGVDPRAHA